MYEHENFESWDEFRWEQALRESDDYAAKYFKLLRRFCDLPGANELIADHMGPDFQDKIPDCELDCDGCPSRWECDFAVPAEWIMHDEDDEDDSDDEDDGLPDGGEPNQPPEPGDSLFYETDPLFVALRQTALGWCNIYSVVLPTDARKRGINILFDIGRALANIGYSIGDGLYEQPAASVAFAKRSLAHLNRAFGRLNSLTEEKPSLRPLLETIRKHLLRSRTSVIDHLRLCRQRLES
jgi:hypothetical protein